jgi:hypothetical protein
VTGSNHIFPVVVKEVAFENALKFGNINMRWVPDGPEFRRDCAGEDR